MSDIEIEKEDLDEIEPKPLEVKIINQKEDSKTPYDSTDDSEHSDINITSEEIEEFEKEDDK